MNETSAETFYYIRRRGKVHGPYDLARAQLLVRQGRLARHDEVSTDRATWKRASEFPELFPAVIQRKLRVSAHPSRETEETAEPSSPTPQPGQPPEQVRLWFYSHEGGEQGPVAEEELIQLIRQGHVEPDAFVWSEGMDDWAPWQAVPSLRQAVGSVEPSPPTLDSEPIPAAAASASVSEQETRSIAGRRSGGPPALAIAGFSLGLASVTASLISCAGVVDGSVMLFGTLLLAAAAHIVGIILSHLALAAIRKDPSLGGMGLTITGLILGYTGLFFSVISVLICFSILDSRARRRSQVPPAAVFVLQQEPASLFEEAIT